MRKIILSLAVSLDGFIEGPNGEIDWIEFTEEAASALNKFLERIDTVLYGRTSYEKWGTYTPTEESAQGEKDFYAALDQKTKYVFSTSKSSFEGNPLVLPSVNKQQIEQLKQQPGKDIWLYGGSKLITHFINLDLVDEFNIAVMPIVLGTGNPLFKEINHRVKLQLLKAEGSPSGIVELDYITVR